tara:strand:- start:36528 stop:37181 length:654 start_codon:yes stop_codon:yes gene_type:complete
MAFFMLFSTGIFAKEIELGVTELTLKSHYGKYSKKLLTDVFKELGHNLKVSVLPHDKLEKNVLEKKLDGELIRMSKYGDDRPYLVKADVPQFFYNVAVYGKKDEKISDWSELKGKKIGFRKGLKIIEIELLKHFKKGDIFHLSKFNQANILIGLGRIDYFVEVEKVFDDYLKFESPINLKNVKKIGILKKDTAHLYLRKELSHLIPSINKELKKRVK